MIYLFVYRRFEQVYNQIIQFITATIPQNQCSLDDQN